MIKRSWEEVRVDSRLMFYVLLASPEAPGELRATYSTSSPQIESMYNNNKTCQNAVCHSELVLLHWSCDDGTSCSSATMRPRTSLFNGTDCWEWWSWPGWSFTEETVSWGTSWGKVAPAVGDVWENTLSADTFLNLNAANVCGGIFCGSKWHTSKW